MSGSLSSSGGYLSGLNADIRPLAHIWSTIGDHTLTVTATDRAGNVTTVVTHYKVVYTFNGFFSPITNTGQGLNLVHAGDLIKIGFSLNGDRGLSIGFLIIGMALTPLLLDDGLEPQALLAKYLKNFESEVMDRLKNLNA